MLLSSSVASAAERQLILFRGAPLPAGISPASIEQTLQRELDSNLAKVARVVPRSPSMRRLWAARAVAVELSPEQIATLRNDPAVLAVESAEERIPAPQPVYGTRVPALATEDGADPTTNAEIWGLAKMGVPAVRTELGLDGSGVIVGHFDSGINAEHPALRGKVIAFRNYCYASGPFDCKPYDNTGHGTHTAGTIAGSEHGIGIAPGVRFVVAKMFDSTGGPTVETMLTAMQWIMNPDGDPNTPDAPQIINNSWSANGNSTNKAFWEMMQTWKAAGIVPVFSAGNFAFLGHKVDVPGAYPHTFAVGATDQQDAITHFSQPGPAIFDEVKYLKPDVSAPGFEIVSADYRGGYVSMNGTSMAAPHVSGMLALLAQANPRLSPDQLADLCRKTAVDIGKPGPDNRTGAGRVDALAAARAALAQTPLSERVKALPTILAREKSVAGAADNRMSLGYVSSLLRHARDLDENAFAQEAALIAAARLPFGDSILRDLHRVRRFSSLHGS